MAQIFAVFIRVKRVAVGTQVWTNFVRRNEELSVNWPEAQFITTEISLLYAVLNIKWNYDRIVYLFL